ncbi:hypothetical protein B9Z51_07725 [Limnohabitans sp. T6-5]|uniref:hypothetical protein n=1 Tax=Limnohabitans sp. T6-5 TaxID=1100724 RepID=UPI000D36C2CF|nr:hypothetical protein [Limnohabitans sp. T6-5]PUE08823.1 hypothetical protein B9Z51_07725 [Limnohabitans sp. T6-5]
MIKRLCWLMAVFSVSGASAQTQNALPEHIVLGREKLTMERQVVMAAHEQQARDCWQKLAVNACLSDVRKVRRQALEPIRQQELRFNEEERQWRTEQRQIRLEGKQPESRSSP